MREYYKDFSKYAKGKTPDHKVAWVTAFTPVEILEALGISYYYPESYAAVIAASEREQALIEKSAAQCLSRNCCSYSCCFNGCLDTEEGPRGVPPRPDVLIATNNQCNTLPNWWNLLSVKYNVPLIVLDYPGDKTEQDVAAEYVSRQHKTLIAEMERLSGNTLDEQRLAELIENSKRSVEAWKQVIRYFPLKDIAPTLYFDDINFLITARCKAETSELYHLMAEELAAADNADNSGIPAFWLGYPLWYHADRYLEECLDGFHLVGSNYITWWNLSYEGQTVSERLFSAYNYTFLNLSQKSRDARLRELIKSSGAKCAVVLHNKSCKCDYVSARNISIPQAELEIDMIDRSYLNIEKAQTAIDLLKDTVCIE